MIGVRFDKSNDRKRIDPSRAKHSDDHQPGGSSGQKSPC